MAQAFPRTLTLAESFRAILRAQYSARPALADEIQGYDWFHNSMYRAPADAEAAYRAITVLKDGIKEATDRRIRLRGTLNVTQPIDDIDPADSRAGVVDVFENTLEIEHDTGSRKYFQVHCYETDLPLNRTESPRAVVASNGKAAPAAGRKFHSASSAQCKTI